MVEQACRLGISYGPESDLYSFPGAHPMNKARTAIFSEAVRSLGEGSGVTVVRPEEASEKDLLMFHTKAYVDFVRESSERGTGNLDYGDTPSFKGVYEASLYPVGSTLLGVKMVLEHKVDHFFNPIGGLHHARRDRAGGFCVFNDAGVAIEYLLSREGMRRVAYVDIDAHQGDGVYYSFESDPRVTIADVHEDGRYIYPGTGASWEAGSKGAEGTKLNVPMPPWSGDTEFFRAFDRVEEFVREAKPEFILLQCGADCLGGDPITSLSYTCAVHAYAAKKLHRLAHEACKGRLVAMGGGGYDPQNVAEAWTAVMSELSGRKVPVPHSDTGPWW
jgi:acetoin utilization protein AcuC